MPTYKHARPRGFAPWKPRADTLSLLQTVLVVLQAEAAYLPLTNRQVFYRLVQHHGYTKTEQSYDNLCNKLNRARRAGLVPWGSIRDDKLSYRHNPGNYSVEGFREGLHRQASRFALDPYIVQDCMIEVHVEAEGMMPQVARAACPLGCSVYSSGGFGSVTTQYDAAKRMVERVDPTVVLSIGDYDPSGIALYQSFKENVLSFFETGHDDWDRECWQMPLFRRIAVTPEQIRQHGFITAPQKAKDRRGNWSGGTVQCEAIPSAQLAQIVRDAVLEHYDADAIAAVDALSLELREPLDTALYEAEERFVEQHEIAQERRDEIRAAMPHRGSSGWKAGYDNADDDFMEEGIQ